MPHTASPIAVVAAAVPPRTRATNYPSPFVARMVGREKRTLGELIGLRNFGVNLTRLVPGASSSLRHAHSTQDEFVYILEGHPTLHTNEGLTALSPGMCAGFRAGSGNAHRLLNTTAAPVLYLEIDDRATGDECSYPDDEVKAMLIDGAREFLHKDGTRYA